MNEYYVADSNLVYDYINNGISDFRYEQCASSDNIVKIFNKMSQKFCPIIIKSNDCFTKDGKQIILKQRALGASTLSMFSMPESLEVIDPREFGIKDSSACMVYDIYKCSIDNIINRMKKIAQDLAIKNEDLANYLSLTIKVATNNKLKNSKISYKYIENKLEKEDVDKLSVFKKAYEEDYNRAIKFGVLNAHKSALLSAIVKAGVKFE